MKVWKKVFDHEKYLVSNDAEIKVVKTGKLLTPSMKGGYMSVTIDGKSKKVHRLVANAFVPNDDLNMNIVVDHVDGHVDNNHYTNLEWVTTQENNIRAAKRRKVTRRKILQIEINGNFVKEFESIRKAEEETNIDKGSITRVCKGENNMAGGYKWKYVDEIPNEYYSKDLSDFIPVNKFPEHKIAKNGTIVYIVPHNNKTKAKEMKVKENPDGYPRLTLTFEGKQKSCLVHRLVAEHFVPKVEGKNYVNHIDGDRSNYHANNLEWVTARENVNHAFKMKKEREEKNNILKIKIISKTNDIAEYIKLVIQYNEYITRVVKNQKKVISRISNQFKKN